jgi:hypothetical protein
MTPKKHVLVESWAKEVTTEQLVQVAPLVQVVDASKVGDHH